MRSILSGTLLLFIVGAAAVGASPVWAENTARVITVHEGDRLTIYHQGKHEMIVLKHVDCPELKQPFGKHARRTMAAYVAGREVIVRHLTRDARGRLTADILLQDGRNVGTELVKEGLAWWKPGSGDPGLGDLEELARAEGKGLWADANPVPPWKWKARTPANPKPRPRR